MYPLRSFLLTLILNSYLNSSNKAYASFSGKYSADYSTFKCVRECEPGGPLDDQGLCVGSVDWWVTSYDTLKECCEIDLFWRRHCIPESLGTVFYTDKFYLHPDWRDEKCVRDCDPNIGPPCMGNAPDESGIPTAFFDTAEACCQAKVWWNPSCVTNTHGGDNPIPTSKPNVFYFPPTSPPTYPSIQTCSVDSDCLQICEPISGQCVAAPTAVPTKIPSLSPIDSPTTNPTTAFPTISPTTNSPSKNPTVIPTNKPTLPPTSSPTSPPSNSPTLPPIGCQCTTKRTVPSRCEVEILIDALEEFASSKHGLLGQWLRAAFHDAGTFDQVVPEGGANGCLLNHLPMRRAPSNAFLDMSLLTLQDAKEFWHDHDETCINVSSADITQFSGFFAALRQTGTPGLTSAKRSTLINNFQWGRPDESSCDPAWADNLPDFRHRVAQDNIPLRCTTAGREIKETMIDRNGFTAAEATALIGGHSIGTVRNTFGSGLAGPWVVNGADNATPDGPIMDNTYHRFLTNSIVAKNANEFSLNQAPFDTVFPDWFREDDQGLDYLDTDIALAFPSLNITAHPDFSIFSRFYADDNDLFLASFFTALDKMGKLGVSADLSSPGECGCQRRRSLQSLDASGGLTVDEICMLAKKLGNSTAHAGETIRTTQYIRMGEIVKLTKKMNMTDSSSR